MLRSQGLIPDSAVGPLARITGFVTIVSMAVLGLSVDVRLLAQVGSRVTLAVTASLLVLLAITILLVRGLGIG